MLIAARDPDSRMSSVRSCGTTTEPPSSIRTVAAGAGPPAGTISSDPRPVVPIAAITSLKVRVSKAASVYDTRGSLDEDCPAGWKTIDPLIDDDVGFVICANVVNFAPPKPVTAPATGM